MLSAISIEPDVVCAYCSKQDKKSNMHRDHIVPKSKGGSDSPENFQWLCPEHNLRKSNCDLVVVIETESLFIDKLSDSTIIKARVKLRNYPKNLPNLSNVRDVGTNTTLYKEIVSSAVSREDFIRLNKGVRILASDIDISENKIICYFKDLQNFGILDGGHTNSAIVEAQNKGIGDGEISIEVAHYKNIENEARIFYKRCLNSVIPVEDHHLNHAAKYYSVLEEAVKGTNYEGCFNNIKKNSSIVKQSLAVLGSMLVLKLPQTTGKVKKLDSLYMNNTYCRQALLDKNHKLSVLELNTYLKETQVLYDLLYNAAKTRSKLSDLPAWVSIGNGVIVPPRHCLLPVLAGFFNNEHLMTKITDEDAGIIINAIVRELKERPDASVAGRDITYHEAIIKKVVEVLSSKIEYVPGNPYITECGLDETKR